MNGIVAPIVAVEPASAAEFLRSRPSVSVVMVVYMTGEALEQSVACVLSDPLVDEFVIVDNGSTAADGAHLRSLAASLAVEPLSTMTNSSTRGSLSTQATLSSRAAPVM